MTRAYLRLTGRLSAGLAVRIFRRYHVLMPTGDPAFVPSLENPVDLGIRQGFANTSTGAELDGIPHS